MSTPEMNDLFARWVDGNLSAEEEREFEAYCAQDTLFAQRVAAVKNAELFAHEYTQVDVPDWNRATDVFDENRQRWWQREWLPAASFATSILAIVMVVSGFRLTIDEGAVTLSFSSGDAANMTDSELNSRLDEFSRQQQLVFLQLSQQLQVSQTESNAQLVNYLLNTSRAERKEDFTQLIQFVNEQRRSDQIFYAEQLTKIRNDVTRFDNARWPVIQASDEIH